MPDSYLVGEVVRLRVVTSDIDGLPADPGSITLKVKSGSGAVTAYTGPDVVRDGTGIYHADIALNEAGILAYRWELTAPNAGAAEGLINVQKSRVI